MYMYMLPEWKLLCEKYHLLPFDEKNVKEKLCLNENEKLLFPI